MSSEQLSQLDYVFKNVASGKVKTDAISSLQTISAANESYSTVPIISSGNVWAQSDILLRGASESLAAGIVQRVIVRMASIHNTNLPTLKGVSWISGRINWVNPSFNLDFIPQFYSSTISQFGSPPGTGFISVASSINFPFVFDYGSGILTFIKTPPSIPINLADVDNNVLWIDGYVYTGTFLSDIITGGLTGGIQGPTGPKGPSFTTLVRSLGLPNIIDTTTVEFNGNNQSVVTSESFNLLNEGVFFQATVPVLTSNTVTIDLGISSIFGVVRQNYFFRVEYVNPSTSKITIYNGTTTDPALLYTETYFLNTRLSIYGDGLRLIFEINGIRRSISDFVNSSANYYLNINSTQSSTVRHTIRDIRFYPTGLKGDSIIGPTGPVGPVNSIIFDGGNAYTDYGREPILNCGSAT